MTDNLEWWNKKHHKYALEDWIKKPSIFAEWAIKYFPQTGKILELGAGQGQDTRYFAQKGYQIVSSDFSDTALKYSQDETPEQFINKITFRKLDISRPFPFQDKTFDVVYCHLSLHYFNDLKTGEIFSELYRILKPGGIIAILVNSINDPENGQGTKIEDDFYEINPGDNKHFFSKEYMAKKAKKFETYILDDQGTTYKDKEKGVDNLIRFVGRRRMYEL